MTSLNLAPSLPDRKAEALARIDVKAEEARLRWITDGAGQAQEYRLTEDEARAYQAAGAPAPFDAAMQAAYPFIHAEMLAMHAAAPLAWPMGTQAEIDALAAEVATHIIALADAWRTAAAEIKRLRREAKLRVEAATTHAEIREALQIAWPSPA